MTKSKFRNTVVRVASASSDANEQDEIINLKSEMAKMNSTLDRLVDAFTNNGSTISNANDVDTQRQVSEAFAPLSSTRLHPIDSSPTGNDSSVSLHVSNIANDISQTEVIDMIKDSIGATHISSIKLLVPPWKDLSALDYISFKVDVNVKFRDAALDPSSWPEGVRCREFRSRLTNAWRPLHRN